MMKPWGDLDYFEKMAVVMCYRGGATKYVKDYIAEQEKHQKMITAVDKTLALGSRLFRRNLSRR